MGPIAIIGMACRFPGADDVNQFWTMIQNGVDAIQEVPDERWSLDRFYDADPARPGTMTTRHGGFLSRITEFDASFFGISPREAANMDPQQRLLLETAWEALESAGQVPETLAGSKTGVFVGQMYYDYGHMQTRNFEEINPHTGPGSQGCISANRLSYFFDFRGPSLSIDTACSSSLVAIHQACLSLQSDDSAPLALACGVNVILSPVGTLFFSKAGVMTADGRTKTFDARANGFARSEGVGVLVLKPLARALEDKDPVLAVIRGSAVNQDGRTNGIMAPNRFSQEALLKEAYAKSGVAPSQIQYIEAHGTGTLIGDPIEANAIGTVLREGRNPDNPCLIGSVKSNIGHGESSAGMAGVIKVVQMLRHKQIAPNLHYQSPNPHIPFDKLPLRVVTELEPWPQGDGPRLAGVSGFGFGGTNAHVVLEEAPTAAGDVDVEEEATASSRPFLLPLSARSPEALHAMAQAWLERLEQAPLPSLPDLLYTASRKRTHHDHRLALVSDGTAPLQDLLRAYLDEAKHVDLASGRRAPSRQLKPIYVFTGQGSQWTGMGRQLLEKDALFRRTLTDLSRQYEAISSFSVLDELLADEQASRLNETIVAQPAIVLLQLALVEWLGAYGIKPQGVIGHSIGEVTASYVAGVLTLDETLRLLHHRSRIMQRATGAGRMAAVRLTPEEALPYLQEFQGRVTVAVVNEPGSVVLAGDTEAMSELEARFASASVTMRYLPVQYAFHSPQLEPYREELQQALADLRPQKAALKLWSTLTGALSDGTDYDAAYWGRQMCETVQFADAVQACAQAGFVHFLEIGPHPVLLSQIRKGLAGLNKTFLTVPTLQREEEDERQLLRTLGTLHVHGYRIDWKQLAPQGRLVPLPAYPWQREHYWFETNANGADFWERVGEAPIDKTLHPLLGERVRLASPTPARIWQSQVSKRLHPWLDDHRIQGKVVVPGATYLEVAVTALRELHGEGVCTLRNLQTRRAFFLEDQETRLMQAWLSEPDAETGQQSFNIYSTPKGDPEAGWLQHAEGLVSFAPSAAHAEPDRQELEALLARFPHASEPDEFYRNVAGKGLEYGPTFQGIGQLHLGRGEALARMRTHELLRDGLDRYSMHPALLDACGHLLLAADEVEAGSNLIYMPVGIREVRVYGALNGELWSHAVMENDSDAPEDRVIGRIRIFNEEGRVLVEMDGLEFQRLGTWEKAVRKNTFDSSLYEVQWQERPLPQEPGDRKGLWLLLCDADGVGDALASRWQQLGSSCIRLYAGETFQELGDARFSVRPGHAEDLRLALATAQKAQPETEWGGAVHLWSLNVPSDPLTAGESFARASRLALESSAALVKVFSADPSARRAKLHFVTRGAQAVDASASVQVNQAPLWGLARSLPMEHPGLWGGLIDLDASASAEQTAELLSRAVGMSAEEDQLAVRNGRCFVPRLTAADAAAVLVDPVPFSQDGAYLITGGLGALGLQLAKWLADHGVRHLLLIGRTALPPRSEWAQLDASHRQARQVEALLELEQQGVSVETAALDVSNTEQLQTYIRLRREQDLPGIRGVFHLAGNAEGIPFADLTSESITNLVAPKLAGTWALHTALAEEKLDHFVLFSSASALMPSPMIAAYGAANAALDGFAHYRRSLGLPALSINWGPFGEVGMAILDERNERRSFGALRLISPQEALDGMHRLLAGSSAHLAVFPIDHEMWHQLYGRDGQFPIFRAIAGTGVKKAAPQRSAAEPVKDVDAYVRLQVAGVLRLAVDKLDTQESMLNLGLDSLMLTELKHRIEQDLNVSLPLVSLLQGPSVQQLGELIREQQADALPEAPPASETPDELDAEQLLDQLDDMSEEEIERLLSLMADEED